MRKVLNFFDKQAILNLKKDPENAEGLIKIEDIKNSGFSYEEIIEEKQKIADKSLDSLNEIIESLEKELEYNPI